MSTRSLSLRLGVLTLALAFVVPLSFGQMPQQGNAQMLSSSDVSDEQIQKVARIAVTAQMSTREEQMKMRKDAIAMKKKMANMDSTQKAQARREFRKRQMALRKKQMQALQKQAKKEGMDPQMVRKVLRSARQDSTLANRLRTAMKAEAKRQRSSMQGGGQ